MMIFGSFLGRMVPLSGAFWSLEQSIQLWEERPRLWSHPSICCPPPTPYMWSQGWRSRHTFVLRLTLTPVASQPCRHCGEQIDGCFHGHKKNMQEPGRGPSRWDAALPAAAPPCCFGNHPIIKKRGLAARFLTHSAALRRAQQNVSSFLIYPSPQRSSSHIGNRKLTLLNQYARFNLCLSCIHSFVCHKRGYWQLRGKVNYV